MPHQKHQHQTTSVDCRKHNVSITQQLYPKSVFLFSYTMSCLFLNFIILQQYFCKKIIFCSRNKAVMRMMCKGLFCLRYLGKLS